MFRILVECKLSKNEKKNEFIFLSLFSTTEMIVLNLTNPRLISVHRKDKFVARGQKPDNERRGNTAINGKRSPVCPRESGRGSACDDTLFL